ncbi:hypothetical protein GSI_03334 [Ganoderma sinense ZZ0214-1]|uniref:DUF7704 domain-containing protein n=1 Tax=Ganoderma sinense ZZ0214-1 TaxID=1077348 RepID=A0A2G8SLA2_9APHY|nr:hypothetical protein GSI_03334 [Ganoderma sinense ZZ0214-1]
MSSSPIPTFYRVVFTLIDPFFCALGVATHLFTKNDVIAGLSPTALVPPAPETALLLDFLLGFFAMLGCLQVSLLRARPNDVPVWRALQGSTLVLDVIMTAATARKLVLEGRVGDPGAWLGGEWQNLAGNAAIGAVRAAFVLGIGMGGAKGKTA